MCAVEIKPIKPLDVEHFIDREKNIHYLVGLKLTTNANITLILTTENTIKKCFH